eukprot:scaffold171388_cov16-Tisochrysis_lutea.AAC.1
MGQYASAAIAAALPVQGGGAARSASAVVLTPPPGCCACTSVDARGLVGDGPLCLHVSGLHGVHFGAAAQRLLGAVPQG